MGEGRCRWQVLKGDSLPSPEQIAELENDGWLLVTIVPVADEFFVYLRSVQS